MTDYLESSAGDPREYLALVRNLRRSVRSSQRGTWFALLVLGVVTLLAIPVQRFAPRQLGACRTTSQIATVCTSVQPAVLVYWPLAAVIAYTAIVVFYVRRSRRRGVGTRVRLYVVLGTVLAAAVGSLAGWRALHPRTPTTAGPFDLGAYHPGLTELVSPMVAIGLALLTLACAERSRALLVFGVVYLAAVITQAVRVVHSTSPWWFLPQLLLPAALLLLGAAAFAVPEARTVRGTR